MAFNPRLVFVTTSNLGEARKITQVLLEERLAACVNFVPGLESHYWWEGKLQAAEEVLMIIKTTQEQFPALQETVRRLHSYTCPEIVAVTPGDMSFNYRAWWQKVLQGEPAAQTP